MMFKRKLSVITLALAASMPWVLADVAHAQNYASTATAKVDAFSVQQLSRVTPGSELQFTLNGTPGAEVSLRIDGANDDVRMVEARPGSYTASYTVRTRDRLSSTSRVTARLVKDGQTAEAALNQSLVAGARSPAPLATAAASKISAFTVEAPERIRPGDDLVLSMTGAPGGKARAAVQGVASRIAMTETERGVYEGRYTLRRQDQLNGDLRATGFLMVNQQETSLPFERRLAEGTNVSQREVRNERQGQGQGQSQSRARPACSNCGVVASVNRVEVENRSPNVLGTIAGGVLGGVLGNQVGGGNGRSLATIAGAVGGGYAGNRIEDNMSTNHEYRVVVRLESGATQSFSYAADPAIRVGAPVKIENGAIVRR